MEKMIEHGKKYMSIFCRWLVLSAIIGLLCGIVGASFRYALDFAHHSFDNHHEFIYILPMAGLFIVWIYRKLNMKRRDTNTILESLRSYDNIPIVMAPLIFISTFVTHLFGGSSGKEGAALQMGGAIGSFVGRKLHIKHNEIKILIMCGMSSIFATFFLTPLTASVFSVEVINVGTMYYGALLPCLFSSIVAVSVAALFGFKGHSFEKVLIPNFTYDVLLKTILVGILATILSVIFCLCMHYFHKYFKRLLPSPYIRVVVGGIIITILTLLIGNYRYNGAGIDFIYDAVNGSAMPYDFILKLVFTVITLGAGYKGGEILPSFYIGATFGNMIGPIVGLDPHFAAALGLVTLFSAVVNCPIAGIILSCEFFGAEGIIFFALVAIIGYTLSGYTSLYDSQKIMYDKLGMARNTIKVNQDVENLKK